MTSCVVDPLAQMEEQGKEDKESFKCRELIPRQSPLFDFSFLFFLNIATVDSKTNATNVTQTTSNAKHGRIRDSSESR